MLIRNDARSEKGCGKWHFLVWNRVKIWRIGWHTPTKNFQEYPPGNPGFGKPCTKKIIKRFWAAHLPLPKWEVSVNVGLGEGYGGSFLETYNPWSKETIKFLSLYHPILQIEFIDDLPRNLSGKVVRRQLRDKEWNIQWMIQPYILQSKLPQTLNNRTGKLCFARNSHNWTSFRSVLLWYCMFPFDALEGFCPLSFRKLCYAHTTKFEGGTSLEYCPMTNIWKTKRRNLKVDFHCRVIFPCVRT